MRTINAGKYRHKVDIQKESTTGDSYGEQTNNWSNFIVTHASIEPLSGREFFAAQQNNSEVELRIRIRYKNGIKPIMRVKYGTRIFDILSVIDFEERHQELQLMCRELV